MDNDAEFQKMKASHLRLLLNDGRSLIGMAASAAELLKLDQSTEVTLSNDEKTEFFRILTDSIAKYSELMDQCRDETQAYINDHYKW